MNNQFFLGEQDVLTHMHIGRQVYLSHYEKSSAVRWKLTVYVGTITGFTEHRGSTNMDTDERPDDLSSFPDYNLTIFFEHGPAVYISAGDRAEVFFPRELNV